MDSKSLEIERLKSLLIQERRQTAKLAAAEKTIKRLQRELELFYNFRRALQTVMKMK